MKLKQEKTYILLNNIGSPKSPTTKDVRAYLREFLMDPKVIQVPWFFRFILVYGIISFFRAGKSAHKYQSIWLKEGSPLLKYTQELAESLAQYLTQINAKTTDQSEIEVIPAMRYQEPSIKQALLNIGAQERQQKRIIFAPMYPQWAESTTSSAEEKFKELASKLGITRDKGYILQILKPFWDHPLFVDAWSEKLASYDLGSFDVLLFSYHGLPEAQILKNSSCKLDDSCCEKLENCRANCYRAQCLQTTKLIIDDLKNKIDKQKLNHLQIKTSFQSRLGKSKWIEPYTETTLINLGKNQESRKVLVLCPAFVTDCLETLEEIQIESRSLFLKSGGDKFEYVPSLNGDKKWIVALGQILNEQIKMN